MFSSSLDCSIRYLSSGDHLQASQWPLIAEADLSSASATHFLTLIPSCCWQGEALYMEHVQKTEDTRLTGIQIYCSISCHLESKGF